MTSNALSAVNGADILEQVIITGNLAQLKPKQRVEYYAKVCESVGLNPLTRPFDYITLNSKLTLYAKRDAADQLRKIHGISIEKPEIDIQDDLVVVTVNARDRSGRTDADVGAVPIANLKGEAKANAILKAITKAKRRVTLSLAGLGWLDETEVDSIPGARRVAADYPTQHADAAPEAPARPLVRSEDGTTVDTDTGEIVEEAAWEGAEEAPAIPTYRVEMLNEIVGLEKAVCGNPKHIENAREKYLGTRSPAEATDEALSAYLDRLNAKLEEKKAA